MLTEEADNYWLMFLWRLTDRLRERARSHTWSRVDTEFVPATDQMWERACSRRGRNSQIQTSGKKKPRPAQCRARFQV